MPFDAHAMRRVFVTCVRRCGIAAAARVYFDKKVPELSLAESAMLAGLIRAPSKLNPQTNLKQARARATLVLQAMVENGAITREQALAAALNAAAPARGSAVPQTGSWFGDWVYNDAMGAMRPLIREARIRTTLQPKLQKLAESVVRTALDKAGGEARAGQAALVAMSMDGAVVAMVGGRSYKESQFNRAASAALTKTFAKRSLVSCLEIWSRGLLFGWTTCQ